MLIKDYCDDHGITKDAYYYRLRKVREAAIESSGIEVVELQVADGIHDEKRQYVPAVDRIDKFITETVINAGTTSISVNRLKQYYFVPSKVGIEEVRLGVYSGKKSEKMVKGKRPAYLIRNSLISPYVEA